MAVDSVVAVDLMTKLLKLSMTALDLAKRSKHETTIKILEKEANKQVRLNYKIYESIARLK